MSQRTTPGSPDVDSASDLLLKNLIAVKKQQKIRLSPVTLEHVPKEEYVDEELGLVGTVTSHTPTLLQLKSQLKKLRTLLEQFKLSSEDGLVDKSNFDQVVRSSLSKRFDHTVFPAFHRIYEAFDLDGYVELQQVLTSRNGKIDFVELATGMSNLLYGDKKDMMKLVFSLFDINNDGSVQQEEMVDFFKKFFKGQAKMNGYKLTSSRWNALEEHLKRIFTATDLDSNGTIDFEEFVEAVSDVDHPLGMLFLSMSSDDPAPQ